MNTFYHFHGMGFMWGYKLFYQKHCDMYYWQLYLKKMSKMRCSESFYA